MKNILLISIIIIGLNINAQPFISASGGLSLPIVDYASNDYKNAKSGYSLQGFYGTMAGGYMFNKYIGAAIWLNYTSNKIDLNNYTIHFLGSGAYLHTSDPKTIAATTDNYQTISSMFGMVLNIPINDKNNIGFSSLIGLTFINTPMIDASSIYTNSSNINNVTTTVINQPSQSLNGISFQEQLFYKKSITEHFAFGINTSLFYCNFNYTHKIKTTVESKSYSVSQPTQTRIIQYNQPTILSILTGLSIQYNF